MVRTLGKNGRKIFYIIISISLVAGMILSAIYGIFGFLQERKQEAAAQDEVVALVNGEEIIRRDYSLHLENMKAVYEMQGVDFRTGESHYLLRELEIYVLEELINQRLILQQAQREGITVSQEEIQDEYDFAVSQFDSEEDFLAEIAAINFTRDEFKKKIYQQLMIDRYLESYLDTVEDDRLMVSEEEMKQLYDVYSAEVDDLPEYDELKWELEEELIHQKREQLVDQKVDELKEKSEIQIML